MCVEICVQISKILRCATWKENVKYFFFLVVYVIDLQIRWNMNRSQHNNGTNHSKKWTLINMHLFLCVCVCVRRSCVRGVIIKKGTISAGCLYLQSSKGPLLGTIVSICMCVCLHPISQNAPMNTVNDASISTRTHTHTHKSPTSNMHTNQHKLLQHLSGLVSRRSHQQSFF